MVVDRFHIMIIRMIDVSYILILCCHFVTVTTYTLVPFFISHIMCNVYSLRVSYTNRPKSSKTFIIMLLQLWIHNTHISTCTWTCIISNLLCYWPALDGSRLMIAVCLMHNMFWFWVSKDIHVCFMFTLYKAMCNLSVI